MNHCLTLQNDIDEITVLGEWVEQLGETYDIPADDLFQLNMVLEEAVVNIVEYAYPGQTEKPISLAVSTDGRVFDFVLTDEGVQFDPTKDSDEPDIEQGAEERPIGGLGIYLVKQYMSNVRYRRENGKNILSMTYELGTMSDLKVM